MKLGYNCKDMKDKFAIIFIVILGIVMYGLTLHGDIGNPTVGEFKDKLDQATNAFELSPERGRYIHIANMADSGVYNLSPEWGAVAYPDVGISKKGKINSYFAPGVAYIALPFYIIGNKFGLAQVATFSVESLISIITLIFIYLIGRRVFSLPKPVAFFTVLIYGFASVSWSYSTTLYQHAFSTFFIVTGFYAVWRFSKNDSKYSWVYASYVWLAYALALSVDYPNAVLMLPVMVYFAISAFPSQKVMGNVSVSIRWAAILTFIVFAFVIGLQFWHNATYYNGWSSLAGELQKYKPTTITSDSLATTTVKEKTAIGFFHEYRIPNGFYVLLFSAERGLFFFSPIFIFSLLGVWHVIKKKTANGVVYIVPLSLIAVNIFLYSSWGDPWGGWAYGPRYLIPSMPWLALFVGVALSYKQKFWKILLACLFFLYSSAIALLGVLTSNVVPPRSEAILLPIKTYNFLHDIPFLLDNKSNSFIYKVYFADKLTLLGYLLSIYVIVLIVVFIMLFMLYNKKDE